MKPESQRWKTVDRCDILEIASVRIVDKRQKDIALLLGDSQILVE